ncbi:Rho GTPase activation protein [Penicillium capsulatum]|uniref:Rho GTPase activation protein n=1 Tax=Penicillium capsulatum TaxID=69766 RepID=A0A9W9HNU2_9EURO|nr:Rho GTPase activation protein [Penicillium capsulatum]KAJ6113051.1 Rho GTPase activation protein [Penicillium capsulatum]
MSTSNVNPLSGLPATDPLNPVGVSPFTTNPFSGDFLALPIPEDDPLWGLSPVSPSMTGSGWNAKGDAVLASSGLERDFKNTQVRNGQPTPPPYEEQGLHAGSDFAVGSATKRRRVRESQLVAASLSPELDDDEPPSERAKRAKFLERNRLAASKCRQKKKEHTQKLEHRYKEQSDKKEQLVGEIARLRSEILSLKNEVLKHAQCGDEPIKLHLAQMVKRITDTDGPPPAPADPPVNLMDTLPVSPPEAPPPPTPNPQPMPAASTTLSFGFDDPLQLEPTGPAIDAYEQIRRESGASIVTESSYAFSAEEDPFEQLIDVT